MAHTQQLQPLNMPDARDESVETKATRRRNAEVPSGFFARAWMLIRESFTDWSDDNAARLAAALACYTLLSIAPLIVLCVVIAGMVFGEQAARGQISGELGAVVGAEAGSAIQAIVASAKTPSAGIISSVVGVIVLLFGASGVFGELQSAMNTIWQVKTKPGRGVKGFIRDRFFSITMVVGVAFLLLVSLVASAALSALGRYFESTLPGGEGIWQIVNWVVSLGVTTLLFGLMFKVVPDVRIQWRDVWVGASLTAVLFTLGKFLLALYIGKSSATSAYGAAGSLVALVIWVYYSSQVLFVGAEFTQAYARHFGGDIKPSENAVYADEKAGGETSKDAVEQSSPKPGSPTQGPARA